MRFLLVYDQAKNLGGAQTLIARMANWLVRNQHEVQVLFLYGQIHEGVRSLFDSKVELDVLPSRCTSSLAYPSNLKWYHLPLRKTDVVIAFCCESSIASEYLTFPGRAPRRFTYVIYVSQYCSRATLPFLAHPGILWFRRQAKPAQMIFMSEQIRNIHAESMQKDLNESAVMPLPLELARFSSIPRSPQRFAIVSVGRIDTKIKPYSFACVDVIKQLREEGYPLTWTVYGGANDPRDAERFERHLVDRKVLDYVHYEGEIKYDRFPQVLTNAYAFIGMGTAVLEAAAAGLPSIVAIAEEAKPITQGLVHEMPSGSCGEIIPGVEKRPIVEVLRELLRLDATEYQEMCHKESQFVMDNYDIGRLMARFVAITSGEDDSPNGSTASETFWSRLRIWFYYRAFRLRRLLIWTLWRFRRLGTSVSSA